MSSVGLAGRPVEVYETRERLTLDFSMLRIELQKDTATSALYNRRGDLLVKEETLTLEREDGGSWKSVGAPVDFEHIQISEYEHHVKSYFDDGAGTSYIIQRSIKAGQAIKATVKITVGQDGNYRLAWNINGLPAKKKTKAERQPKNVWLDLPKHRVLVDRGGLFLDRVEFNWGDIHLQTGKDAKVAAPTVDADSNSSFAMYFALGVLKKGESLTLDPSTVGTSTDSLAVALSFQHKSFYAAGRYWVFYFDGTNMVFRSSTDGSTWSSSTTIAAVSYGSSICVWFDGTYVHYARSNMAWNAAIYYRRGTPQSDGSISWSAAEQTARSGSASACYYIPVIAVDSSGYAYIAHGAYYSGHSDVHAEITKNANNDGTWSTASGYPVTLKNPGGSDQYYTFSVVPLTSGKLYCLYAKDVGSAAPVYGKLTTDGSSWGSEENASSGNAEQTDGLAFISGVAVSDDIYQVYLEDVSADIHMRKRTYATSTWETEETVRSSTTFYSAPVLAKTSSGDLYCFWIGSPTANHIYYKKRASGGSWDTDPTDWLTESNVTWAHNICCYYEALSSKLGVAWQTGTGSPYNVRHDYVTITSTENIDVSDTGSGSEVVAVSETFTISDAGSDAETITIVESLTVAEVGAGLEAITVEDTLLISDTGLGSDVVTVLDTIFISCSDSGVGADAISAQDLVSISELGIGCEFAWHTKGLVRVDSVDLPHVLSIRVVDEAVMSSKPIQGGALPKRKMVGKPGRVVEIEGWSSSQAEIDSLKAFEDGTTRVFLHPSGDSFAVIVTAFNVDRNADQYNRRRWHMTLKEARAW